MNLKLDYPELEGTEVIYFTGARNVVCIVAGCSWDIGLTIVEKENMKNKHVCINRRRQLENGENPEQYDNEFWTVLACVQTGFIDGEYMFALFDGESSQEGLGRSVGMQCAFI